MSDKPRKPDRRTLRLSKEHDQQSVSVGTEKQQPRIIVREKGSSRADDSPVWRAKADRKAKPYVKGTDHQSREGRGETAYKGRLNSASETHRPLPPKPWKDDAKNSKPALTLDFFAPSPRGLEAELAKELESLGAIQCEPGSGGVAFRGNLDTAWKANLWSRLAVRILQRVGQGRYRSEDDLYQAALHLPWPSLFTSEQTIAVRTVAHASPLQSLNFVTLKIKDAVCDRFRREGVPRPDVDTRDPRVPILLYLERERYSLYLDLSGQPLNRRGYRVDASPAPLNENLAAGLLKLAGWKPNIPLLDPMMGGGTILLEAAMQALNIAPGIKRHFSCENLLSFDRAAWSRLREEAQAAALEKRLLPIYGRDRDPRMLEAAKANLTAAGLDACVSLEQEDFFSSLPPAPDGMIVTNPPYGVRLEADEEMHLFYQVLGDRLKQHYTGWTAFLLSADLEMPKYMGLKASRRTPLYNGPLECRLLEYRMVAGSLRQPAAD